jgi:large subunit ribosomal protein L13
MRADADAPTTAGWDTAANIAAAARTHPAAASFLRLSVTNILANPRRAGRGSFSLNIKITSRICFLPTPYARERAHIAVPRGAGAENAAARSRRRRHFGIAAPRRGGGKPVKSEIETEQSGEKTSIGPKIGHFAARRGNFGKKLLTRRPARGINTKLILISGFIIIVRNDFRMSTTLARRETVSRKWYVLDAKGRPLGRLAAQAAVILRGKHKPDFTPNVDCGDFVVVVNAAEAVLTGDKLRQKYYRRHSGWVGGLKEVQYKTLMETRPELAVKLAVNGMLAKNSIGRSAARRLRVFKGAEHIHAAQKPVPLAAE